MSKELKSIIISAIITVFVTAIIEYFLIFLSGNKAKIELVSSKMIDGSYQSIISIKNLQGDEYLKDVEIKINDTINLDEIKVNGELNKEKYIKIDKVEPKGILIIKLISKEKINKKDLILVKNNQKMEIESFNEYTDYKLRYLNLIVIYGVINGIILAIFQNKSNKEFLKIKEEANKKYLDEEKEYKLLNKQVEEIKIKLKDETKKAIIQQTLYIKEMNNMERENELYRMLLKEKIKSPLTQVEFETLISRKVSNLKKSNIKNFRYEDIVKIVDELCDINNKN